MSPKHRFQPRHRLKRSYQRVTRFGTALLMLMLTAGFAVAAPAANAYTIHPGDTLTSIARHFHVSIRSLIRVNHIRNPNLIYAGHHLIIPGHRPHVRHRGAGSLCAAPRGQLPKPVSPAYLTQGYRGPYPNHSGIDFAGPHGSTVRSVAAGTVVGVWWWGYSYGHHVLIRNQCAETLFAHLSSIYVHVGQNVGQGQAIGTRDSTGNSTGDHLHFEIIKNGYPVNPAPYFFSGGAQGGAGNPQFLGHDKAVRLIRPLYDWRTKAGYGPEIIANFNVARAAKLAVQGKHLPILEVSPCLTAHAQAFLQENLSRKLSKVTHDGLVTPLVLHKGHIECGPWQELVAHGHRRPDLAMYDWLLNHHNNPLTGPSQFSASESTMPTTRQFVLDPRWRSIGVATASLNGFQYEIVLVGTKFVATPGLPFAAMPPGR